MILNAPAHMIWRHKLTQRHVSSLLNRHLKVLILLDFRIRYVALEILTTSVFKVIINAIIVLQFLVKRRPHTTWTLEHLDDPWRRTRMDKATTSPVFESFGPVNSR